MGSLTTGGGSSAVAASAHAGCQRFRVTDPLIVGMSRRAVAATVGAPDTSAGIPEARWMRAMTFERLVHSPRFASELLTTAVGQLGLARPRRVRRHACGVSITDTAQALGQAHTDAVGTQEATMLIALAVPFLDLEADANATPVKPDFAIVCPQAITGRKAGGSWLIIGDAKDYERVRARIDDARLLKGFLQVALGAESASAWSKLPGGMTVHPCGALAVPRNAFLQPEAIVEQLDDHRAEVRARAQQRTQAIADHQAAPATPDQLATHLASHPAEYDPQSCVTCSLFNYCRNELRSSPDPMAVLTEIGIDKALRPALRALFHGGHSESAPPDIAANVTATITGRAQRNPRLRTDSAGLPGTVNLVLAKSDAAALGVHGVAVQTIAHSGASAWKRREFLDPQSPQTRHAVMRLLGAALASAGKATTGPVHLVVPDTPTADLLVAMADSLAGVELSRLRWQRDLQAGRPPLTFDGEPATLPDPLDDQARLAVSFLLEDDRARGLTLRQPITDLRAVLNAHLVAGGPAVDSGRLDYLLQWAAARGTLDHRAVSDQIAGELHTPGARLSNTESDAIHAAYRARTRDPAAYRKLVRAALDYKIDTMERALAVLDAIPHSRLHPVYLALEADAQAIWQRRAALKAYDLVRFSRTFERWRNDQVSRIDKDAKCARQLAALIDPQQAAVDAHDAGVREVAAAAVLSTNPIRLRVASRRLTAGTSVALLHVNGAPTAEQPNTTVTIQQTSFKFGQVPLGLLGTDPGRDGLRWSPTVVPRLTVGDQLILADAAWFGRLFKSGTEIAVQRPELDKGSAPKPDCTPASYANDPQRHKWCCRPHDVAEAEWADTIAERRARGELNPQTWPPLIDEDRFDVAAPGDEAAAPPEPTPIPAHLTLDDLD